MFHRKHLLTRRKRGDGPSPTFVYAYMPGCGQCVAFSRMYNSLVARLRREGISSLKIDGTKEANRLQTLLHRTKNVTSFPSLFLKVGDNVHEYPSDSELSEQNVMQWIKWKSKKSQMVGGGHKRRRCGLCSRKNLQFGGFKWVGRGSRSTQNK